MLGSIFLTSLEMTMTIEIPRTSISTEESIQDEVKCSFADNPDTRRSTSAYLGITQVIHMFTESQRVRIYCSSVKCKHVHLSDVTKEITFGMNLIGHFKCVTLPSLFSKNYNEAISLS